MTILAPSSAGELRAMLELALTLDGPTAIRYPKGAARQAGPGEVGAGLRARRAREGLDVCILAVGKLLGAAEDAALLLEEEGVTASVWDVRVVKPLDVVMLAAAAAHPLVVTVEDGVVRGGVGSTIAAALRDTHGEEPGAQPSLVTLGVPDAYIPHGHPDAILAALGLDGTGIAASVRAALRLRQVTARR